MHVVFETQDFSLQNEVNAFIEEWYRENPALTVQTSGSTGSPKSITINKEHMKASARMTGEFLGLQKGNTALLCLSPRTIAGKMMLVRSIVLELELIITDIISSPIPNNKIEFDFAAMVPIQVKKTLEDGNLDRIKKLIVGGGAIAPELWQDIAAVDIDAYQTFGMTETISHVAMRKIGKKIPPYSALPNVLFSSHEDCLIINAPQLGVHQLETNDVVDLINNKQFEWLGRRDLVINSGGIKIHPEQIEEAIQELFNTPFFTSGLPDEDLGERHILCVAGSTGKLINLSDLEELLSNYIVPKEIYYFDSFVYTESGKIDRINTLKKIRDAKKQVL